MTEENTTAKIFYHSKKRQLLREFLLPVAPKCLFSPSIFPDDDVSHKKSKTRGISCTRQPIQKSLWWLGVSATDMKQKKQFTFSLLEIVRTEFGQGHSKRSSLPLLNPLNLNYHYKVTYPRLAHNTIHFASSES